MTLSSSSFVQLRAILEATFGVTPVTGNGFNLRMTGETLDYALTRDSSKEINASRQVRSLATTNAAATGAVNFEVNYKEYDALLSALMGSSWSLYGTNGQSAAVTAVFAPATGGHDTVTASAAPAGNDAWTKLKKGDYVRFDASTVGSALAANTGSFQLDADGTATVLSFALGSGIVTAPADIIKVSNAKLVIGNTLPSFTLEKEFTDVGQYFAYTGMMVSKMDLSFTTGNFITGSFDFVGKKGSRSNASILPGVSTLSNTYRSMSAVDGVSGVRLGGVAVETKYNTFIKELTVSFDNQLEALDAVGHLGAVGVMAKEIQLTGGMSMYLADGSVYDDFIAAVQQQFAFVMKDPDGFGYAFVFDNIEFSASPVQASADGQSVMADAKWTALMGATTGNSMTIYRL